jgi:hypothetical protein
MGESGECKSLLMGESIECKSILQSFINRCERRHFLLKSERFKEYKTV